MAYANSLQPIALQLCRWFNACCLFLTTLFCLDVFLLPRTIHLERILEIEETYVTFRNIHYNHVTKQVENVVLITDNFRVPFRATALIRLEQADSVQIISSPLLKIIEKGTVRAPGLDKPLIHETGMFGTLMFIPITFALISLLGVIMWHNKEQLLNATVMNVVMLLIVLILLNYF